MRRADERIGSGLVEGDARDLTLLEQAGVPATRIGASGVVRLRARVGEAHLGSGAHRDPRRAERVVHHFDRIRVLDRHFALAQAGEAERGTGRRRRRGRVLRDDAVGIAAEREHPEHVAIGRGGLRGQATDRDCDVLLAVDLIGDGRGVRASAGLPLPQHLAVRGVQGLELAVRLTMEQQPAGGCERAAALPDRIGRLLLPDDLVGA